LQTTTGDRNKLGTYTTADIVRGDVKFTVVNAYTQYAYGRGGPHADYRAIQRVFAQVKQDYAGKRIGYPMLGAGLAGGDWNQIYNIIRNELVSEDHTLVKFKQ